MRRLAVALVVLFAGCSAVDVAAEPTATFSPVPIPDDPPGALVGDPGAVSGDALLAAHEKHLASEPGTQVVSGGMFTSGPDYDYVLTVSRDGARYRATFRDDTQRLVDGSLVVDRTTTDYYSTGEGMLVRTVRGGDVRYRLLDSTADPTFETVRAGQLHALLSATDLEVSPIRTDSGAYRVSAQGIVVDQFPTYRGVVTDARVPGFSATVTPDGSLEQYRFSYAGTLDGQPVYGWVGVETRAEPGVEPPDWYPAAVNATG